MHEQADVLRYDPDDVRLPIKGAEISSWYGWRTTSLHLEFR